MRRALLVAGAALMLGQAPSPAAPSGPVPAAGAGADGGQAGAQTGAPAGVPAGAGAGAGAAQQELIYHGEAASLLGRTVRGPEDAAIGRIVDVLVDDAGQPRAAVVEVGGFMGMGSRRIAVAWRALRFLVTEGRAGRIVLDMTLDQIKDTPEYKRPATSADPPVTVAAPPAK